jgi:serine/threonine protein kinase
VRLTPGTRIGPYEVVVLLGAGGMAEVYRARDSRLGRDVAIKVVSEALGTDTAFLERFEREARLAASLTHPNVVALFDVGVHDGKPYFVTELLQGETLRERFARGILPLDTALEWAAQMAQGLAAAHERGIAHRDLKPENVFISRDGHVKLLDFGIAKLVEAAQASTPHGLMDETVSPSGSSTGTGMVLGTPGYMSPEQVRGDPVDARTDFFSLGAVLYEMVSGHRAFPSGSVVESGYAILHDEPEPLPPNLPAQVVQVVRRCLEKEADRRFQSARDLAFNLELVQAPTGAKPSTATALEEPTKRRWRHLVWPFAAILLALGLSAVMYFSGRASRLPTPSVHSLIARLGRVSAARFNPNGQVVFSAAWDGKPLEVFTQSPGSVEAQALGLADTALMAVSPTGELAVLVRPDWVPGGARGTLALVPGTGGAPREIAENIMWADWSSTGELAVARFREGRMQLEYPLGKSLYETPGWIVSPRVSPNGDSIAFSEYGAMKLVDRRGQVRTFKSGGFGSHLAWAPSGHEVWFSTPGDAAIWATSMRTGETRLVYQGVSGLEVQDISKDGRVLVNGMERRLEVAFAPPAGQPEVRLSVHDSDVISLSNDGSQVLLESPRGDSMSLQPTDGGAPLKLGPGSAQDLSADSKWVLATQGEHNDFVLLPVGPETPRQFRVPGFDIASARFFHDGRRIAFVGRQPAAKQFDFYATSLAGGPPMALSDAGVFGYEWFDISLDDRFLAAMGLDEMLTVYPTDGGSPIPLTGLGKDAEAVAWTPEGHLWVRVRRMRELPSQILLYDISKRQVLAVHPFSLNEATGVLAVFHARGTPDAGAIAFDYERVLGHLYLLDGLAPPLH